MDYADRAHVIVLSVIESPDAYARAELEHRRDLDVTLCATLPFALLVDLVHNHGSMADVLILVRALTIDTPLPEMRAIAVLCSYYASAREAAGIGPRSSDAIAQGCLGTSSLVLLSLRTCATEAPRSPPDHLTVAAIFNDLCLAEHIQVATALANCLEFVEHGLMPRAISVIDRASFAAYQSAFLDGAARTDEVDAFGRSFEQTAPRTRAVFVILLNVAPRGVSPMILVRNRIGPTRTRTWLDELAAADASESLA